MTDELEVVQDEETAEPSAAQDELVNEETELSQEEKDQKETEAKPWYKKRFDEITRQKYIEKQRADEAEKKAQELELELEKHRQTKAPEFKPTKPKPTRDQFDDADDPDQAYIDATVAWNIDQYDAKQKMEREHIESQQKQFDQKRTVDQKIQSTIADGQSKYDDWTDVVFAVPKEIMHQNLVLATAELQRGSEVAYYLGKNLQDAERISQLPPYAMAAELGKIEQKLSQTKKKSTQAPAPVNTLTGGGSSGGQIDPDKNPKEWIAARNRGEI